MTITKIWILSVIAIAGVIVSLIVAGVFKLVSLMIGAENKFRTVFSVTLYVMIAISIISSALLVVILYFKKPGEVGFQNLGSVIISNLGAVLTVALGKDALPKYVMKLAEWVDLLAIWRIALLAIGYSAVSRKLKTSTAATWLGGLYVVAALIMSAFQARSG